MKRDERAKLGTEALEIMARGEYEAPSGRRVSLAEPLAALRERTIGLSPDALRALSQAQDLAHLSYDTRVDVTPESTLAATARLAAAAPDPVLALNFASAKNPGGGFLSGAQAQEESLARSSTLYASQQAAMALYEANRRAPSCLYTHHMIYSPGVTFFRDDDGCLLERPYHAALLTAPAVNVGALKPHEHAQVEGVMRERTELLLSLAASQGHHRLVLGAWGCGVFKNDPTRVAGWFADALNGRFRRAFSEVVFAVYGRPDGVTFQAFERAFPRGA
jgi:uncharacterized protein (TIGR02452 family)